MKQLIVLFLKAVDRRDTLTPDLFGDGQMALFAQPTPIKGYTRKDGVTVAPSVANRMHAAKKMDKPILFVQDNNVGAIPTPSPADSGAIKGNSNMPDFSNPKTFQESPELATLARRAAERYWKEKIPAGTIAYGDFKRQVLAGERPDVVEAAYAEKTKAGEEKSKSVAVGASAAISFPLPVGYAIAQEGDNLILSGPFDNDLHARIKRAGGEWDGKTGTNRRVWIIPAINGASLKRIFSNIEKAKKSESDSAQAAREKADADIAAKNKEEVEALAEARANAPTITPGRYGPFTVMTEGAGYRVLFPYDAERVSQIKSAGASNFRAVDKSWYFDKAKAAGLISILEKAKEIVATQPAASVPSAVPQKHRMLYPLSAMPIIDRPTRLYGKAVVFTGKGESFRISEDHPSTNGSHLLGHEGDRGAYAYYRDATPEEVAALEQIEVEVERAALARKAKEASLSSARKVISEQGDRLTAGMPSGEVLHDTFNIYGGGDRFVIDGDTIWYIRNNGADGDNWGHNNITTGGAGAIGWRVPYSQELADQIRMAGKG